MVYDVYGMEQAVPTVFMSLVHEKVYCCCTLTLPPSHMVTSANMPGQMPQQSKTKAEPVAT